MFHLTFVLSQSLGDGSAATGGSEVRMEGTWLVSCFFGLTVLFLGRDYLQSDERCVHINHHGMSSYIILEHCVIETGSKLISTVVAWARDEGRKVPLTGHEAAIAASGGILSLSKFMHGSWEESSRARTRNVEAATGVATSQSLRSKLRGSVHVVPSIGQPALSGRSGAGRESDILSVTRRHFGFCLRVRVLEFEKEVCCVCYAFQSVVLELLWADVVTG